MTKSKSLKCLVIFTVVALLLIALINLGYYPQNDLKPDGISLNPESEKILEFFRKLASSYYLIIASIIFCCIPTFRKIGIFTTLQMIITFIYIFVFTAIESSGNKIFASFDISHPNMLYIYTFFTMIIINFKNIVEGRLLKYLSLFAIMLFVFLVTLGNLNVYSMSVVMYCFYIILTALITATSYFIVDIRKYYFL